MSVQIKGVGTIGGLDEGLNITGIVTATSFVGSGANLTGIASPAITSIASDGANRVLTSDGDGTATAHSFVTIESSRLSVNRGSGSGAYPLIVRRTDASGIIAEFANSSGYGLLIGQNSATGEAYLRTGTGQDMVFTTNAGSGIANEKVRILSDGRVFIGTTTGRIINSHSPKVQVTGTNYSHSTVSIINNEANGNGAYLFFAKQRSGAVGGSSAVAEHDIIGELRFNAGDGTDLENLAARIKVHADANATSNNTPAYMEFYTTRRNGSSHLKARIHQNNNNGNLFSFGTESTKLNNSTSGDRTSFKIGPATHIEGVFGNNGTPGMYYNCYSGGNTNFYRGTETASGGDWRPCAYGQKYGGHYFFGDTSSTAWSAQQQITSMATNMQITSQGYVTTPNTVSFYSSGMSGASYDNGTMTGGLSGASHNIGNHYNSSNGVFTAPIAGRYLTGCGVLVEHGSGRLEGNISKNNSTTVVNFNGTGTTYDGPTATVVVQLAANDTLRVKRQSGNAYDSGHGQHYFFAHLIG